MNEPRSASGPEPGSGERQLALGHEARRLATGLLTVAHDRLSRWLDSVPRAELVLIAFLVLVYLVWYLGYGNTPGNSPHNPVGWWNWHDQQKQLQAALGLGKLQYGPEAHHYLPGYALLAAPFVPWMPNHPFFVPNLCCFVGIGVLLYRMARQFLGPVESAGLLVLIGWLAEWELKRSLVVPWSTIPTHFLAYLMIWLYLTRDKTKRLVWQLALLDGLAYSCRPGDAAFLAPLVLGAVLEQKGWQRKLGSAGVAAGLFALFPLVIALVNVAVSGSAVSHYENVIYRRNGFFTLGPLVKAYLCFLDGMPIYRYGGKVILERLPWLILCAPGAIWFVKKLGWRTALPPLATMVGSLVLYMGYNSMSPVSLYPFSLVHYLAWLFPLLGLFSYLTFRRALRDLDWPVWTAALLLPILLAWTVRLVETDSVTARVGDDGVVTLPAGAAGTYDLVVLRGAAGTESPLMSVSGKPLQYSIDFHRRRDFLLMTFLGGHVIHLAEPVDPRNMVFSNQAVRGRHVEFRRLRWSFEPLPPMVRKLMSGNRGWGVDQLHRSLVLPAAQLSAGVGEKDLGAGTIRTTGRPGALQFGPYIRITRGRYVAEWYGSIQAGGEIQVDVTTDEGKRIVRQESVTLSGPAPMTRFAQLEFFVEEAVEGAEYRLHVDERVRLTLHRVVLKPRILHDY